jgi:hypothetical protein
VDCFHRIFIGVHIVLCFPIPSENLRARDKESFLGAQARLGWGKALGSKRQLFGGITAGMT